MSANYNLGLTSPVDQIRLRLGDTNVSKALFQDEEIDAAYAMSGGSYDEAVFILQKWGVNRLSSFVDFHVGDAGFTNSQRQKMTISALEQSLVNRGGVVPVAPFVGGISIADKVARESDADAVGPIFTRTLGDFPGGGELSADAVKDPEP